MTDPIRIHVIISGTPRDGLVAGLDELPSTLTGDPQPWRAALAVEGWERCLFLPGDAHLAPRVSRKLAALFAARVADPIVFLPAVIANSATRNLGPSVTGWRLPCVDARAVAYALTREHVTDLARRALPEATEAEALNTWASAAGVRYLHVFAALIDRAAGPLVDAHARDLHVAETWRGDAPARSSL